MAEKNTSAARRIFTVRKLLLLIPLLAVMGLCGYLTIRSESFVAWKAAIYLGICLLTVVLLFAEFPIHWIIRILVVLALPTAAFYLLETMTHIVWDTMKADAVLLNLAFYYLAAALLFVLLGSTKRALTVLLLFAAVVGAANYYVILFRSSPILPWDLLSLGTAASVAGNYTYSMDYTMAWMSAGFLFALVLSWKTDLAFPSLSRRWGTLLLRLGLLAALCVPGAYYIHVIHDPDIAEKTSLDNTLFTPKYMFRTNGFAVAFLMDMRYLNIEAPAGYSKEAAREILARQELYPGLDDTHPNILVIMDECFSDPAVIAPFDTAEDYMPFIHSLQQGAENTISGWLYMSVLGGNTANSEFEYLTGNTMAFLPKGSVPYQQYLRTEAASMVPQYNALGYETVAMHPYNASGWNRNKVYALMGFDRMLFSKDFLDRQILRKYVSDACDFANVLRIVEETEEPVFIYNVTMQNHSGFADSTDPDNTLAPKIEVQLKNTKTNQYLTNYLTLMQRTDTALEAFFARLEALAEPTIVVFFGDHQPYDHVVSPIYRENGMDINNQTLSEQQDRQKVPFLVWANYDINEASGLSMSANYLGARVMQLAGLPLSAYQSFLVSLSEELPAINALGYLDTRENYHTFAEVDERTQELLKEYQILQYYFLFDGGN